MGRPCLVLDNFPVKERDGYLLSQFLLAHLPQTLNVAGSRESSYPGIAEHVRESLRIAQELIAKNTKGAAVEWDEFSEVWTCGPEGAGFYFAEAGMVAEDPDWRPSPGTMRAVSECYWNVTALARKLDLPDPAVLLLPDKDDERVGEFVHGTENSIPLVIVYPDQIARTNAELDMPGTHGIEETILHELAHAYLFSRVPLPPDFTDEFQESACESFCRNRDVEALKRAADRLDAMAEERVDEFAWHNAEEGGVKP
jgi:hypothetical protein